MTSPETKPVVLCIDDESSILASLGRQLSREFEFRSVQVSGTEDLAKIREAITALPENAVVVSDLRMSGVDGREVIKEVHRAGHKVLTLSGTTDDLKKAPEQPDDVMTKPWEMEVLRARLRNLLGQGQ